MLYRGNTKKGTYCVVSRRYAQRTTEDPKIEKERWQTILPFLGGGGATINPTISKRISSNITINVLQLNVTVFYLPLLATSSGHYTVIRSFVFQILRMDGLMMV
jgi:hypothetical protein